MLSDDDFPLCLIGESIASSPSRAMQEAALRASGRPGTYELVSVAPPQLPGVLHELRSGRWRGANVTAPYKLALAAACDELEGDAQLTGAVNTLTVTSDSRLLGANTDAAGFELALSAHGLWPVAGSRALVVGAGGAAAAIVLALTRVPVERTTVVARRINAARALIDTLAAAGVTADIAVGLWDEDYLERLIATADIVVNATSAGLSDMPFTPARLQASCTVADVRYRPRPVDVVAAAAEVGLRSCDGVDMLLHQGMLSFRRWTGDDDVPYAAARRALEEELGP
ncbi:MAG: shikimate dehydrogenase [Candidatus Dormibacteraeota bacterium]|uniref:shikimate dehydrogenase (NADP(+)) n=1 Tax=Candidatus Aeolococcus gillhamiae TaxID=3127015 RepID=A0A2W5ZEK3_9BACT|nr:shikimate dehydrogenase [Candidatus Dormibacteraeota bacterium]PZR81236.1 MAG: shikimate dehydrogenase [Candidatus Dormibacter sp. RRmetagenome_bin12]